MAGQPPFLNSTGLISKILGKITEAQKPERFTHDYLTNVLGFSSGSARPIIGVLKRIGFLQADGTPTPLYSRFRNESERASAMLEALRIGYPMLYARSEFAHTMPKEKLRQLVVEVTGLKPKDSMVTAIVGTFEGFKSVAGITDKTKIAAVPAAEGSAQETTPRPSEQAAADFGPRHNREEEVGLNLSYTINLNLPASPDPEVFNAIFKALKEHLLTK